MVVGGWKPQERMFQSRDIKRSVSFIVFVATLIVLASGSIPLSGQAPPRPVIVGRSRVASTDGIVATSQPLASQAGAQILARGGNAVDAAIAAAAVMALVEPHMNGLGGDVFAIFYEAKTGKLYGLNGGGWAPTGLTPAFLAAKGMKRMPPNGIYSVTVPGAVAGWEAMRSRFGKLRMSDLLQPAIGYAERGFPVSDLIADWWARTSRPYASDPAFAKTYLIDGRAPNAGEVYRNPDLARSLRLIGQQGTSAFYEGEIARAILARSKELGGTMTAADLREYKPEWVDPISTTYRGWTLSELPPNTQGVAALAMLNIMEQFPLAEYGFQSAKTLHVMIEAKKLAYADMLRYVGDPAFTKVPIPAMISKEHGQARSRLIDPAKAACQVEPSVFDGLTTSRGGDTIYLSTIDRDGNIVSLIQSIYEYFGSGVVAPGTGFVLHNRGELFSLDAAHPNVLAPRKRPLHTIIPGFLYKDGVGIGFGIMSGFNQAQAHAQYVSNVVDFGLDIQEALEAGRFTKESFSGCDVHMEVLVPEKVRQELKALGHEVIDVPERTGRFGYGQAVMNDGTGTHFGASEPRHDGAAVPEPPPLPR
jgi:gamma-glutamyltranspeptidase/glutathione hydrolase